MTSSTSLEARRGAILQLLQAGADAPGDGELVAERAVAMFEQLCVSLVPLIGASGTSALLDRCVHERGAAFGWTRTFSSRPAAWAAQLGQLRVALARLEPAHGLEAAATLFEAFTAILGKFIGEGLTAGMLHDLWPGTFPERTVPA